MFKVGHPHTCRAASTSAGHGDYNHGMTQPPVSDEIAAALARFYFNGGGPSHSKLTTAFTSGGYLDAAPYDPYSSTQQVNKETRVIRAIKAATRRPSGARALIEGLLVDLRVGGFISHGDRQDYLKAAQRAFSRNGWLLSDDGYLSPTGLIDLSTGGRAALDEQIGRLRRGTDDAGQLLGSAKDLLESVAKYILEELDITLPGKPSFSHIWHIARERLGILPQQVSPDIPGANNIREVLQSSWKIAEQITNYVRFRVRVTAVHYQPVSRLRWHS
jgi:hypothetical protein